MDFVVQMWRFLGPRRKYWLLPIFIITVVLGGLLVFFLFELVSTLIYTLF